MISRMLFEQQVQSPPPNISEKGACVFMDPASFAHADTWMVLEIIQVVGNGKISQTYRKDRSEVLL